MLVFWNHKVHIAAIGVDGSELGTRDQLNYLNFSIQRETLICRILYIVDIPRTQPNTPCAAIKNEASLFEYEGTLWLYECVWFVFGEKCACSAEILMLTYCSEWATQVSFILNIARRCHGWQWHCCRDMRVALAHLSDSWFCSKCATVASSHPWDSASWPLNSDLWKKLDHVFDSRNLLFSWKAIRFSNGAPNIWWRAA